MRILITTPYPVWPDTSGGARRTLGIANALASAGHAVTLLARGPGLPDSATHTNLYAMSFHSTGRHNHFYNPRFNDRLQHALKQGQDIVLASFPYQAHALVRICNRFKVPLVYDAHNVEADRFRRVGNPAMAWLIRQTENLLTGNAREILAVSEDDRRMFFELYGRHSALLPNGVDVEAFLPAAPDPGLLRSLGVEDKRVAIYCGSFDYKPNVEALSHLLQLEWPIRIEGRPDTHLLVVGRKPPRTAFDRPGVSVTGAVEDIVAHLRLAHLVLAPLKSGGGTRLKIIEALACGQKVLSTHFGAMGIGQENIPGLHLCRLAQFNDELQRMLGQDIVRGSNSGGRTWAESMNWKSSVTAIDWESYTS